MILEKTEEWERLTLSKILQKDEFNKILLRVEKFFKLDKQYFTSYFFHPNKVFIKHACLDTCGNSRSSLLDGGSKLLQRTKQLLGKICKTTYLTLIFLKKKVAYCQKKWYQLSSYAITKGKMIKNLKYNCVYYLYVRKKIKFQGIIRFII